MNQMGVIKIIPIMYLDENQKEIIDNVYAELGDWGYTYEPSAIPASKISFFMRIRN